MSLQIARKPGHGPVHEEHLYHQFEDRSQQDESYVVGMWAFLVTEIMMFGALFLVYVTYRWAYQDVFYLAHLKLDIPLGTLNTAILLTSSLFMALAVHASQVGKRWATVGWLTLTILLAFAFLGVKSVEYSHKFHEHLFPGGDFRFTPSAGHGGSGAHAGESEAATDPGRNAVREDEGNVIRPLGVRGISSFAARNAEDAANDLADKARLFFGLYFTMTGLHAIHIIIGILLMGVLAVMKIFNSPTLQYYMPIEMVGLYWHFVDIVWIFLFPLYYLIPK